MTCFFSLYSGELSTLTAKSIYQLPINNQVAPEGDLCIYIVGSESEDKSSVREPAVISRNDTIAVFIHALPFPFQSGGGSEDGLHLLGGVDPLAAVIDRDSQYGGYTGVLENRPTARINPKECSGFSVSSDRTGKAGG